MHIYHELTQTWEETDLSGESTLKNLDDLLDVPLNHCKDFFIVEVNWGDIGGSSTAFYNKAEVGRLISDLQEIYDNMNDVIDPKESSGVREYYGDELPWEYNDNEF
jgi:hypothetical protein